MGGYTEFQKLYKLDSAELVDVESNLNYNWRLLDEQVESLLRWKPTNAVVITGNEKIEPGYKFFKINSNALMMGWKDLDGDTVLYQDTFARVETWTPITTFIGGHGNWTDANGDATCRLMYRITEEDTVELRGRIKLTSNASLPLQAATNFAQLPAAAMPPKDRYAWVLNGNAEPTSYSASRIYISSTDGIMQYCRYGAGGQTTVSERYIDLANVQYSQDT